MGFHEVVLHGITMTAGRLNQTKPAVHEHTMWGLCYTQRWG